MSSAKVLRHAPYKTVRVLQRHIDHADRAKSRTCAIAHALSDDGGLRPVVHRGRVSFTIDGERFSYIVPPTMAEFIVAFDKSGARGLKPTRFQLREGIVAKAGRTGAPDKTQKSRHAAGGRAARRGYKGKRAVVVTNTRMDGFAVTKHVGR